MMENKLCELCDCKEVKYVCPKCEVLYCSVDCYRSEKHSECSENFYKQCVEEELKLQDCAPGKDKINEILMRTQAASEDDIIDSDDEENDDADDLASRLANVDLDDEEEVWGKLNSEEKKAFRKLISSGDIRNLLPKWQPWWKFNRFRKLITEIGNENENPKEDFDFPEITVEIVPFSQLSKKTPAASMPFLVANVLMAYAYMARWFKGKHCDMPVEGATMLFSLSSVVRNNEVFATLVESFVSFENDLKNCKFLKKNEISCDMICEDIVDIVQGARDNDTHFSVKACLCDIHNIVMKAIKDMANDQLAKQTRFTGTPPSDHKLKLLSKKLLYYLSWTEAYGEQLNSILNQ